MNLKGAKRCSCGVIQGVLSLSLAWWLSMLSPIWYLKALKYRQPVSTERFLLQRQLERKQNLGYAGESQLFGDDTNYLLLWEHLATMQGWEGAPWFLSSGPEWQIVFKKLSPNLLTSTSALIFHIPQHPKHPLRLKSPVVTTFNLPLLWIVFAWSSEGLIGNFSWSICWPEYWKIHSLVCKTKHN